VTFLREGIFPCRISLCFQIFSIGTAGAKEVSERFAFNQQHQKKVKL
jgi:hypothetical protein